MDNSIYKTEEIIDVAGSRN